jgi:probable phosphoglycerate mutase
MENSTLKKLFIIRHGETDPNKNHIIQGSGLDASINSKGRSQASDFYNSYKHIAFDKVYTSKLTRTSQSVEQFITSGLPHTVLEELNEISWGVKDGTRINPEEAVIYQAMLNDWQFGLLDRGFENGESPNQVAKRLSEAMRKIMKNENEKQILICTHGRALRILLCLLLKKPLSEMETFIHSNLCLYILSWNGQIWNCELSNNTSHLFS